jgi:hypothetical protein
MKFKLPSIHPRDFVRLKDQGKTAKDMTKAARLVSQAKNYARMTSRDARGMTRAIRLRKNIGAKNVMRGVRKSHSTLVAAGGQPFDLHAKQGGGWTKGKTVSSKAAAANARSFLDHLATRENQWQSHGSRSRRDTAMRVGAAALGTAGAIYGMKAYRKYRDKAREKTKYRKYGVVKTAHGHVAVGDQVHNQPYYNEVEPRHVYGY